MSSHLRIAFDATPLLANRTGIAYYIEQMAVEMAKAHPETQFIGFYYNFLGRRDTSTLPQLDNLSYVNASVMPSKIVYQLRRWGIEFPIELIALTKADFILYGNFLGYPSLRKTPSAMVIHDLTFIDLPQYVSAKLRSDLVRFVPKQIQRSSFLVTVSEFSKQRIKDEFQTNKDIIVTPIPPVDLARHDAKYRHNELHKLGIHKPFLLFMGTIEPRKNIIKLVESYVQLPKELRDKYTLVIAGRIGWNCEAEEATLEQVAKDGYDVKHLGYVTDEIREILYESAALFTTASHYEGFGMPILEAMHYGTPCAISDIPVFHEVAGTAADYFDQERPSVIASHLESILTDDALRKRLGRQGKLQADSFKWRTVAEAMYQKIKRTIDEQK